MPPPNENPIERRERFIRRVLAGASHASMAREFQVTARTIRNWLARPKVAQRIQRAVDASLDSYTRRLVATSGKAHGTLVRLLGDESSQVRLGAARSLLAPLERLIELRASLPPAPESAAPAESLDEAWAGLKTIFDRQRGQLPTPPNGHGNGNGNGRHP